METQRQELALLTDLYELTMAYGYWKSGMADKEAVFSLTFRTHPFDGGFTVAAGLNDVVEWLQQFHFTQSDLDYLAELKGADNQPMFEPAFLEYLGQMRFSCSVEAIPEGTVVFPHEPLVQVQGPIIQGQLLETALLNLINFPSLVATKAARVCIAAKGEPVLEFGLRRAQGVDGGLTASRAAYVGGCAATSNVLAGKRFGIPVKGTHAHSWVMSFDSEQQAFQAYAEAMPNNCVFLVDTYNTLEGVRNAVESGRWLRSHGHEMAGIRLDSGDLAYLSLEARKILDEAGFPNAVIVASNELDEHIIASLKNQGAAITVWGVGTKLVTAYEQPALNGGYKLTAVRQPDGSWSYRLKLSEQAVKMSNPGIQQVRRFSSGNEFIGDLVYETQLGIADGCSMVDPKDFTRQKQFSPDTSYEDLLLPVFRNGNLVYSPPALDRIRQRTQDQLARFHSGIKRFVNPHEYPVGLEQNLHRLKMDLIFQYRHSQINTDANRNRK